MKTHLQEIMNIKGISSTDVSNKTGIHKGVIECFMDGNVEPTLKQLILLSRALSVTVDEILTGKYISGSNDGVVIEKAISLCDNLFVITTADCREAYRLRTCLKQFGLECWCYYKPSMCTIGSDTYDVTKYYISFKNTSNLNIEDVRKKTRGKLFDTVNDMTHHELIKDFVKIQ